MVERMGKYKRGKQHIFGAMKSFNKPGEEDNSDEDELQDVKEDKLKKKKEMRKQKKR